MSRRALGPSASGLTLDIDYIDLFLIHDPLSGKTKRLETYKALLEAKEAGKIRSVGVSNYGVHHLKEIEEAGYEKPSINQVELHPLCQQKEIAAYCDEKGIVVEAYCPIIRGEMDKPAIQKLAKKYERDPAQILLRWSLQKGCALILILSYGRYVGSDSRLNAQIRPPAEERHTLAYPLQREPIQL